VNAEEGNIQQQASADAGHLDVDEDLFTAASSLCLEASGMYCCGGIELCYTITAFLCIFLLLDFVDMNINLSGTPGRAAGTEAGHESTQMDMMESSDLSFEIDVVGVDLETSNGNGTVVASKKVKKSRQPRQYKKIIPKGEPCAKGEKTSYS
jgi:hypothetical protein